MNNLIQLVGEDAVTPVAALSGFPVTEEIDLLWRIGLFSSDDERNLRKLWRILKGQTDDYLDMVFGMVAAYPALATTLAAACRENLGMRWTAPRPFAPCFGSGCPKLAGPRASRPG